MLTDFELPLKLTKVTPEVPLSTTNTLSDTVTYSVSPANALWNLFTAAILLS